MEAIVKGQARGAVERLLQVCAATVSGASMAGAVAKRATRAHEEAPTITVSRPQPLNEDLSDCAEACGEASGLRSSLASVGHRSRAYGRGEAGVAQLIGGRQAGENSTSQMCMIGRRPRNNPVTSGAAAQ
jgi:1-aminocyclopropane-1-carboxylate deaminase/D-cysteine desulfhydrase-like pyridoxal-dependent ACC family enzyme